MCNERECNCNRAGRECSSDQPFECQCGDKPTTQHTECQCTNKQSDDKKPGGNKPGDLECEDQMWAEQNRMFEEGMKESKHRTLYRR